MPKKRSTSSKPSSPPSPAPIHKKSRTNSSSQETEVETKLYNDLCTPVESTPLCAGFETDESSSDEEYEEYASDKSSDSDSDSGWEDEIAEGLYNAVRTSVSMTPPNMTLLQETLSHSRHDSIASLSDSIGGSLGPDDDLVLDQHEEEKLVAVLDEDDLESISTALDDDECASASASQPQSPHASCRSSLYHPSRLHEDDCRSVSSSKSNSQAAGLDAESARSYRGMSSGTLGEVSKDPWDADSEEFDSRIYQDLKSSATHLGTVRSVCKPPTVRGSVRSPWDADEDEFDPQMYQDLKSSANKYTPRDLNNTSTTLSRSHVSLRSRINHTISTYGSRRTYRSDDDTNDYDSRSLARKDPEEERLRAQEQYIDMVADLATLDLMNPTSGDLHDHFAQEVFLDAHPRLPAHMPERHMHILDWRNLVDPPDDLSLLEHVKPRLCDAVATVLFHSQPAILDAFLDPEKKVVEWWRRTSASSTAPSIVIRRDGLDVLVGIYRSHGFKLMWTYYVKSVIDLSGKWTERYACASTGTTDVVGGEVKWDTYKRLHPEAEEIDELVDEKWALSAGRDLGKWLLKRKVWDSHETKASGEWVVDGVATVLSVRGWMPLRSDGIEQG